MKLSHPTFLSLISKYQRYVIAFFIIFYIVGFMGLVIPYTHHMFIKLFPSVIILSFAAILVYHREPYNVKTISVLALIVFTGFLIEVVGVKTHLIFGNYTYGEVLGFKIFSTPLIIGLNWVMLSYATGSLTENFNINIPLKVITASCLMVIYDTVMEQLAPLLGMWSWKDNIVPFSNYFAWFIMALIFQTFIRVTRVNVKNSIAGPLYLIQILFFIALFIFFKIST